MKKVLNDKIILDIVSKNDICLSEISKTLRISKDELKLYFDNIKSNKLKLFVDGGSRNNPGESGIGVVEVYNDKKIGHYEYIGISTNNEAEYRALIKALKIGVKRKTDDIIIYSDSELICNQINGKYKVRSESLGVLYEQAIGLIKKFKSFDISHVPRNKNSDADRMANKAMDLKNSGKIELAVVEL